MLTHHDIWAALDGLAAKFSLTPSAMARQAGLDPTTFNKSKRNGADGKPRWPSTESLSKVLNMLSVDFEDFAVLAGKSKAARFGLSMGANVPLIGLEQAGVEGVFDKSGFPLGGEWDEIRVPGVRDDHLFALQISGDAMSPVFRHGDRIIVAPNEAIRSGDRLVVKARTGEILVKQLQRMTADKVELLSLNPEYPGRTLALKDVAWMARIIWVTQ